jgi:hypothetical protein
LNLKERFGNDQDVWNEIIVAIAVLGTPVGNAREKTRVVIVAASGSALLRIVAHY